MSDNLARDNLLAIIRANGFEATSFQTLGLGLETWLDPHSHTAICYVSTGKSWVVAGGPIASSKDLPGAMQRFSQAAVQAKRRVIFFCTESPTIDAIRSHDLNKLFTWVKIGEQPAFDPRDWSLEGPKRRTVRSQVRRAAKLGVVVRQASVEELQPRRTLRRRAEELIEEWRESRPLSIMGFLVDLHPFDLPQERRYFIAEAHGQLVGLLAAVPVYRRSGWFVEDLIRHPNAPNGTAEALVSLALSTAGNEGAHFATLGLSPLSGGPGDPELQAKTGIYPWLPWVFNTAFHRANALYSFKGLRAFKEKFKPPRWEPIYMVVSPAKVRPRVIWDMLSAFVPGSRVQFALDSIVRLIRAQAKKVPKIYYEGVAWALSLLLIPWVIMLLSVNAELRFGNNWLPWAWASFDIIIAGAFALLAVSLRHWRRFAWSLSRVMFGAVLSDVWLTSAQILLFNLPEAQSPLDIVVSLVAVAAPITASLFLALLVIFLKPGKHT